MQTVFAILAGLLWGTAAALINREINKKAIAKASTNALLAANVARMAVDVAALGAIFLLRRHLPFRYETAMVAAAVAMSLLTVLFAYRMAGRRGKKQ